MICASHQAIFSLIERVLIIGIYTTGGIAFADLTDEVCGKMESVWRTEVIGESKLCARAKKVRFKLSIVLRIGHHIPV